jgi:hypothetical protein
MARSQSRVVGGKRSGSNIFGAFGLTQPTIF